MRIVKDGLGNVYRDGQVIHTQVRIMVDETKRVAVFDGKSRKPPIAVYAGDEVTFDRSGGCATCHGWPHQSAMKTQWQQYDRQAANA